MIQDSRITWRHELGQQLTMLTLLPSLSPSLLGVGGKDWKTLVPTIPRM